ncbi:MAG: 50S ribosomal protein L4 [Proteobacteria bacterium]|mgnify:CR=1 FL=1|jgi:large subunit ribosomal protein L4|nr:50S ribosomal protein L4 [Pseudomonadota bacterium]
MTAVDVFDTSRNKISQIDVSDTVFKAPLRKQLFYDVVLSQMAKRRSGTAAVKNRTAVSGGGKKPWKQKGTGRARAGSSRSPLWRGGGIVFGPTPRSYEIAVPKKVRKLALCSALSMKLKENKMLIIDKLEFPVIKTKAVVSILKQLGLSNVLIIEQENLNLEMSARNVPHVKVMRPEGLNVYDVLKYEHIVITQPCVEKIQGRLAV